ncbi:MAG: glycine cleavage system aminomethyltransferase GcvT [Myxococcales bacterium]|nr:glycine cleavage system aminomethyltransferase GcvT [Myxococcales bacterium]MCB9709197.1 glycine cleavage system aminomethyltransferase GcvT [Myxococcales bacterium]
MEPPLLRTPLFKEHQALGARLVPFAGYEMPVQYAGIVAEHHAVRQRAGIFDVSHMGELSVVGQEAVNFLDSVVTGDVQALEERKALYTLLCNEQGGIIDDLILYRHDRDALFVVCNASNRATVAPYLAEQAARWDCRFADVSQDWALLALQGPQALPVLLDAGFPGASSALSPFGHMHMGAGYSSIWIARTGYTGEDGVEIFCPAKDVVKLWQQLLLTGRARGLCPCGLGARDTLRLEARLCLHGQDINAQTHPFEAGLGWTVKLGKGDFVGRRALLAAKELPPTRKLVGFEMSGRGIARHGHPIIDGAGQPIGQVTSGSPSPTLGKNIGLGYVPIGLAAPGTSLLIDIRGKAVEANVVKTPFYRRKANNA